MTIEGSTIESGEEIREYDLYFSRELTNKERGEHSSLPAMKKSFNDNGEWKEYTVAVKSGQNPEEIFPFRDFKKVGTGRMIPGETIRSEKF